MQASRVKLTAEEIEQVWAVYTEEPDPQKRDPALREILWCHYESLARYLTRRALAAAPAHQDAEDLLSYAHAGLLKAVERFDPSRGFKFETYATRRITGEIKDGQRREDPLTRTLRGRVKTLRRAQADFWDEHGRAPSDDELADLIDEDVAGVRELRLTQQTVNDSLDEWSEKTGDHSVPATLQECGGDGEVAARMAELADALSRRLASLPERERAFVWLHYGRSLDLEGVAGTLEMSTKWAEKVKREVLTCLRVA